MRRPAARSDALPPAPQWARRRRALDPIPAASFTVAALLALAACTIPVQRRETEPVIVPPEVAIEQFVTLVRSARSQAGCSELVWDARTASVARFHSGDMLRRGYFSHTSPEGVDPFERLRAAGVAYSAAAENIAYGARNGEEAFRQWYGSRGHRRNMLNCHYTRHGVGVVGDRWTHVLWAP